MENVRSLGFGQENDAGPLLVRPWSIGRATRVTDDTDLGRDAPSEAKTTGDRGVDASIKWPAGRTIGSDGLILSKSCCKPTISRLLFLCAPVRAWQALALGRVALKWRSRVRLPQTWR